VLLNQMCGQQLTAETLQGMAWEPNPGDFGR
jgi:hypothetical protein